MKEKFIETCKKIVDGEGRCDVVRCHDCPFSDDYNTLQCSLAGYSSEGSFCDEKDPSLLKSAIKYLEENMCEGKVVLEGKEYDLNDYEIKDINYSMCYPLVEYLLKRGKMVKTRSGFVNKPNAEHPLEKKKKFVKSREQIYLQLIHDGYTCNHQGHWWKPGEVSFSFNMFQSCGKEPNPIDEWLPEWLEEKRSGKEN